MAKRTPLMIAAISGEIDEVTKLLSYGESIDFQDEQGATALMLCCWHGHAHIVAALLAGGANPHLRSANGRTALLCAAHKKHKEIVDLLAQTISTSTAKVAMVKCEKCKSLVRIDRLDNHIQKAHPQKRTQQQGKKVKVKSVPQINIYPRPPLKQAKPRIVLISKRGTKVYSDQLCNGCGMISRITWRYAESNQGTVHICGRCKPLILDRSHGSVDAMNSALSGGGYETSKRR